MTLGATELPISQKPQRRRKKRDTVLKILVIWIYISFHVDNSSSRCSENWKNNFLVLGKGTTNYIIESVGMPERKRLLLIYETKNQLLFGFGLQYW